VVSIPFSNIVHTVADGGNFSPTVGMGSYFITVIIVIFKLAIIVIVSILICFNNRTSH